MATEEDFEPYQSSSSRAGTITQWVDDKGYGWVEANGNRFFAHIKDFDRKKRRPRTGEEVRFISGIDPKGRPCAKRLTIAKADKVRAGWGVWVLICLLLVLPLCALLWLPLPWWMGAGGLLLISSITYVMYAHDKQRAMSKGWRVPESSLHLGELLGGWPGALLAQRGLRHKYSKPGYQVVFWAIVLLYQIAAVDVILNQRLSRAVMQFLNR